MYHGTLLMYHGTLAVYHGTFSYGIGNISRFSRNSETNASEFQENLEDQFL